MINEPDISGKHTKPAIEGNDLTDQKTLKTTLFIIVSVVLFFCYYSINRSYPFYFIWDMDHQVALDLLQINSNMLPSNLTHPGFGIKLLLYFTQKAAFFLSYISTSGYDELYKSVSPLTGVAEITDFYRRHSPFLAALTVLLLWASVNIIFKPKWWISLFIAAFIGFEESLIYHSSLIRSELYCVFYWSAAIFFASYAAKSQRWSLKLAALVLCGISTGLSLLTKVQAVIYIMFIVPYMVLIMDYYSESKTKEMKISARPNFYFCIINTAVFFIFLFQAFMLKMPDSVETLNQYSYGFTKVSVAFTMIWATYLLYNLLAFYMPKINTTLGKTLLLTNFIVSGFILSFLLHLLIYPDSGLSYLYMLSDIKALFFNPQHIGGNSAGYNLKKLSEQIMYNPFLFAVNIALTSLLFLGYLFKFVEIQKRRMVVLALLSTLTYINTFWATRFILRDYLWVEIMVNFVSICFALVIISNIRKYIKPVLFFIGVLFLILFTKNILQCMKVPVRINANYGAYGWKVMLTKVYNRQGELYYTKIMNFHYLQRIKSGLITSDIENALNYEQNKNIVSFILPCTTVNTRFMGFVGDGTPVWVDSFEYKIMEFPTWLKDAITIDPVYLSTQTSCRFKPEIVLTNEFGGEFAEYQDKINSTPKTGILPVYTRQDLDVLLFVHKEDEDAVTGKYVVPTENIITLTNGGNQLRLRGYRVEKYSELDTGKIKYKYFIVAKTMHRYNFSLPRR
ncbi:MAG: hypothetical protein H7844_09830 [Nitrospirae bacterium YQR-1]